jgi:hypothetical protein
VELSLVLKERNNKIRKNPYSRKTFTQMTEYAPKKFRGLSSEDLLLWVQKFRQWQDLIPMLMPELVETCLKDD